MSEKRYYTVVFEITNDEAWQKYGTQFSQSQASNEELHHGVKVTACGEGDAMSQADALNEFALELGHDPDEIVREWADDNDLDGNLIIG